MRMANRQSLVLVKKCYMRSGLSLEERFLRHAEFNMLQYNCQPFAGRTDRKYVRIMMAKGKEVLVVLRKVKIKSIALVLFLSCGQLSGCGAVNGLPSVVENTIDLESAPAESSDAADMSDNITAKTDSSDIVPAESIVSAVKSERTESVDSEKAAENESVSTVESSQETVEPEKMHDAEIPENNSTDIANAGGSILVPSTVLSLTAGSILVEDSIDWNRIKEYFAVYEIYEGDAVYNRIIGKSYQVNDNIGLSELRYLKLLHFNFDGNIQVGELICNAALAQDMIDIFTELFYCRYQICSMHLIDNYWTGDGVESDEASIEVDNTSCFCYRRATDAANLSNHAYGRAIDINPLENPFYIIRPDGSLEYYHTNAEPYLLNRDPSIPHVITEVDDAYRIFTAHGFSWGGNWSNPKDYQHFEKLT